MTFDSLYTKLMPLWPAVVDVSDGYPTGRSGFTFPGLNRARESVEAKLVPTDRWGSLFSWSLFQALHARAKQQFVEGKSSLIPADVPRIEIDRVVRENLAPLGDNDDWKNERETYVGLA